MEEFPDYTETESKFIINFLKCYFKKDVWITPSAKKPDNIFELIIPLDYESDESMDARSKKRARTNKPGRVRSPVLTPLLPAAPTFNSSLKRNDILPGGALVSAVNDILSSNPKGM